MRNFKITVDGNVYDVTVEETTGGKPAITPLPVIEAKPVPVPVAAEPAPAPAPAPKPVPVKKAAAGGTELKAPMPGMVVDYKVGEGTAVKRGQVVLILEAMKMENEIASPADGVISFRAQRGATVDTGELLAVIS